MKKLFIILFLLTVSFRVAAQNEQTKDSTLLNRFPTEMGKEPLSPLYGSSQSVLLLHPHSYVLYLKLSGRFHAHVELSRSV